MRQRNYPAVGKLSLRGGSAPTAWVILPPRLEEGFLERWVSALCENEGQHKKMCRFDDFWECKTAVADLKRSGSMFSQMKDCTIPVRPHLFFQLFLWRELRVYGTHLNQVTEINRILRNISKNVSATHKAAESAASKRLPALDSVSEQLEAAHSRAVEVEKNYWDEIFSVRSFAKKYTNGWETDIRRFPKIRRLSQPFLLPLLIQERNLDSIFQIRVGDLLREYAPNPWGHRLSLLTISRLVILVYICAELAHDVEGNLTIWRSDPPRHLTVSRTYDTLRNAGLR